MHARRNLRADTTTRVCGGVCMLSTLYCPRPFFVLLCWLCLAAGHVGCVCWSAFCCGCRILDIFLYGQLCAVNKFTIINGLLFTILPNRSTANEQSIMLWRVRRERKYREKYSYSYSCDVQPKGGQLLAHRADRRMHAVNISKLMMHSTSARRISHVPNFFPSYLSLLFLCALHRYATPCHWLRS